MPLNMTRPRNADKKVWPRRFPYPRQNRSRYFGIERRPQFDSDVVAAIWDATLKYKGRNPSIPKIDGTNGITMWGFFYSGNGVDGWKFFSSTTRNFALQERKKMIENAGIYHNQIEEFSSVRPFRIQL